MMLSAILLLPRLLTSGSEPPADTVKLNPPRVQYRINEASATRSPWIDANGWRIMRTPGKSYFYQVTGDGPALAAAEAFTYGTDALISTDASGGKAFESMLDFLRKIPNVDQAPVADVNVVDDGSDAAGELMNLLARTNLLYKIEKGTNKNQGLTVRLGTKEYPAEDARNPSMLAHKVRSRVGDENRSLRIYGSEVVIARLTANERQARIYLINYSSRPVRGLRVRVKGTYAKGELRVFGVDDASPMDWTNDAGATEFSIPELGVFAVIDLSR
jgi:hypothetical protein